MRFLSWLLRAAVFLVLFAFALNNQHEAQIKWFLGFEFRAPMVLMVLVVFAAGAVFGVLAMTPNWWRQRRRAQTAAASAVVGKTASSSSSSDAARAPGDSRLDPPLTTPPRDGL